MPLGQQPSRETPENKKLNPTNRKVCGSIKILSVRSCGSVRSPGQMYRRMSSPNAMKIPTMLRGNARSKSIGHGLRMISTSVVHAAWNRPGDLGGEEFFQGGLTSKDPLTFIGC